MQRHLLFIPGPVTVAPAVLAAMAMPMIDHRGEEFADLLERVARGMRPIFGTSGDVVILGSSGTGGLEAAVANVTSPGQHVLVCPVGAFGQRLANISRNLGLEVEILETPVGAALDPAALAARLRADAQHEIAAIMLTQNETSTGVQNDMRALSSAIGDHPATTIVDAISGLGACDFKMEAWGYDIVVTASQKALAVPPGLAMVAVSERAWRRIGEARNPRFYFDLAKARDFASRGQTPWTPPVSLLFALEVALDRYVSEGAENVWARHERYARAIRTACDALGLELLSHPGAHSNTVVAINVPERLAADDIRRMLRDECGITIGGGQLDLKGKILRIGTMGALSQTDVLGALGGLEIVLLQLGFELPVGAGLRAALEVFLGSERVAALS